jgi:hypothetical protein
MKGWRIQAGDRVLVILGQHGGWGRDRAHGKDLSTGVPDSASGCSWMPGNRTLDRMTHSYANCRAGQSGQPRPE